MSVVNRHPFYYAILKCLQKTVKVIEFMFKRWLYEVKIAGVILKMRKKGGAMPPQRRIFRQDILPVSYTHLTLPTIA